jgi:hypothetical protein
MKALVTVHLTVFAAVLRAADRCRDMAYFFLFHNEGYVSRIGLLDDLAGTHKIPLDAVAAFCPEGTGTCIFPSY